MKSSEGVKTDGYEHDVKRTCEANPGDENSSFIFTCNIQTNPSFHFSACLCISTSDRKRIFRNSLLKLEKWLLFYQQSFSTNHGT